MGLLEQLPGILEEVAGILELPLLLLENRVEQVTVKLLFSLIKGLRVTELEFIRTFAQILEQLGRILTHPSTILEDLEHLLAHWANILEDRTFI
ncbi:hypothetical protein [Solibacillus isronensis]|uniref:hypothetical protein n=1 Tax=Solibacillus isronensis TaxID=412383 RepID=UPI0009A8AF51|nr:hypothetical protein [Solibacillus isronensis]